MKVGKECSKQERAQIYMQDFSRKNWMQEAILRRMSRYQENVKMDLKEILCEEEDWFQQDQDTAQLRAFVNTIMNLRLLERVEVSSQDRVIYQLFGRDSRCMWRGDQLSQGLYESAAWFIDYLKTLHE